MKTATKTTRTITGHRITLQEGCRYMARRPMCDSKSRKVYPVSIIQHHVDGWECAASVFTVDGLSYDDANELLTAFNNGETSFEGRVW